MVSMKQLVWHARANDFCSQTFVTRYEDEDEDEDERIFSQASWEAMHRHDGG